MRSSITVSSKRPERSVVVTRHWRKLFIRSLLFAVASIMYVCDRVRCVDGHIWKNHPVFFLAVWIYFAVEALQRFFFSHLESIGWQKQFNLNYRPAPSSSNPAMLIEQARKGRQRAALFWVGLNLIIAFLYYLKIIDKSMMVLISLAYSVCDMICILFYCPFQLWFMKNKCCATCTIYNWDYAMMFTPLLFINDPWCMCLFLMGLIILLRWEITYKKHPEYFFENTNQSLSCAYCKEHLCIRKKVLRLNRTNHSSRQCTADQRGESA